MKARLIAVVLFGLVSVVAGGCYGGGNSYGNNIPGTQQPQKQQEEGPKQHWDPVTQSYVEDKK